MNSSNPTQPNTSDSAEELSDTVSSEEASASEMELFRGLLFGDQIAELEEAREQIANIDYQIRDPKELAKLIEPVIIEAINAAVANSGDLVAEAIAPIIDATIQKKIQQDRPAIAKTLEPILSDTIRKQIEASRHEIALILGPVIAEAITQQVIESPDELIKALAPVMSGAIKEQVRSQRDAVIDALYPVIGSTVARYIKNLFDSINEKLQNSFTVQAIGRKIRARIKGVSEAQLIFSESLVFNIRAAFLIHQSGLLIAETHPPGQEIMEPEMVAGMLTAIRSFVNEWIQQSEVASEIDQIEYGTSKIIIEPVGGFGYLVTVGEGEPDEKFRNQMRTTSDYITEHFSDSIREFDGDASAVPDEVKQALADIPETVNLAIEELVGGKLLFNMGLEFQAELNTGDMFGEESRALSEDLRRVFEANEVSLSKSATVANNEKEGRWTLSDWGHNQNYTIIAEANRLNVYGSRAPKPVKRYPFIVMSTVILGFLSIFFGYNWYNNRIDREIEARSVLALQSAPDLALYRLDADAHRGTLRLSGVVPNEHFRQRANEVVRENIEPDIEIEDTIKTVEVPSDPRLAAEVKRLSSRLDEMTRNPTIDTRIYFDIGESQLKPPATDKLNEIKKNIDTYPGMHLRIIGHSDRSGNLKTNLQLAHKRAMSVRDALVAKGVDASRLHPSGTSQPPPDVSLDQPAYLNRCVLFEPIHPRR